MKWIKTEDSIPSMGQEVIFYYDDEIHIGYISNNESKPRKLEWYSYIKGKFILDLVEWWSEINDPPK